MLHVLRQMGENADAVYKIKGSIGIFHRRRKTIRANIFKGDVIFLEPLDGLLVNISRAEFPGRHQQAGRNQEPAAATTEVKNVIKVENAQPLLLQNIFDVKKHVPAMLEELRIITSRHPHLQ